MHDCRCPFFFLHLQRISSPKTSRCHCRSGFKFQVFFNILTSSLTSKRAVVFSQRHHDFFLIFSSTLVLLLMLCPSLNFFESTTTFSSDIIVTSSCITTYSTNWNIEAELLEACLLLQEEELLNHMVMAKDRGLLLDRDRDLEVLSPRVLNHDIDEW